mgnify:CR=1 FL=1
MVRSDQFDTEFTPPVTGDYVVCAMQFDDGGYVAVGSVEPPFYAELLAKLERYGLSVD